MRLSVLVLACFAAVARCAEPPASLSSLRPGDGSSPSQIEPADFSFEDTAALLGERGILLQPLSTVNHPGLLEEKRLDRILERHLKGHPRWRALSLHLAEVNVSGERLELRDQAMYVAEITGPWTGNCFEFFSATTGGYELGACFYPSRG